MPYKRGDKVESDKGHKETYRVFDRDDKEMYVLSYINVAFQFLNLTFMFS